jgi:hypothetical protein
MWAVADPITEIIAYYITMEEAERGLRNLVVMREEYPLFQDYSSPFMFQVQSPEGVVFV